MTSGEGDPLVDLIGLWLAPQADDRPRKELLAERDAALAAAGGWLGVCHALTSTLTSHEPLRRALGRRGFLVVDARMILTVECEPLSYGTGRGSFGRERLEIRGPAERFENRPTSYGSYTLDRLPPTLERLAEYLAPVRHLADPARSDDARSWPSERNRRMADRRR